MIRYIISIAIILLTFSMSAQITMSSPKDTIKINTLNKVVYFDIEAEDPEEFIKVHDEMMIAYEKRIENLSRPEIKILSKTSEKIYRGLGKPNAHSTLKKHNLNDWQNFIEEYETGTPIKEGMREDDIIDMLLEWREKN